jgi:hypothetical protein
LRGKNEEKYDTDIALLKEAIVDMQQLLKNSKNLKYPRLLDRKPFNNKELQTDQSSWRDSSSDSSPTSSTSSNSESLIVVRN